MADDISAVFGHRVRLERRRLGWSTSELARRAGISEGSLRKTEAGFTCMRLPPAVRVAAALGAPLDKLTAPPGCGTCYDRPPDGFTCAACGATGDG